jgi:hypothetical protein
MKLLAQRGFPLGMKEIRMIAYAYARQNDISGFSHKKQAAGYEWFYSFSGKHPDLSIRTREQQPSHWVLPVDSPDTYRFLSTSEPRKVMCAI